MRRATGKSFGTLATVALLVAVVATIGLMGLGLAPRAVASGHTTGLGHAAFGSANAAPLVAHAAPSVGNVSAAVAFTSSFGNYIPMPFNLSFSATVTNGPTEMNSTNTWVNIEIRDVASICRGGYGLTHNCPTVVNISLNSSVTAGSTSWSHEVTRGDLLATQFRITCPNAPCTYASTLPDDQYQILAWVTINNGVSNATFGTETTGYLITSSQDATLLSPSPLSSISTGNVTVGINYSGSYLGGVNITIYQGTDTTGKVVYTQGLFVPGAGEHVVVASTVWYATTPGSYLAVISVTAPYGTSTFPTPLTVIPAGQTVFQNSSSYTNSSLIPGLSPAVGGTLLLVIGLIVGMIVALALGRAMWGGMKPAPAQPWQAKASNECSVCHQSFATEAELKDHQKTAHGM